MAKQLFKSSLMVSMATMLSRLLGFVRDVLFAGLFGAHGAYDAFVIAFKLPNFMRRLFGEGAFSQAFVPVLANQKQQQSDEQIKIFIGHVAMLLGLSLLVMVLIIEIFAAPIIHIFAPGFHLAQSRFDLAVKLLHWTAPYLFFIAMVAFASAIMNTYKKFFLAAIAPVILNLSFIGAVVLGFVLHYKNIMLLAYAVVVAGFLQCCLLWFGLYKLDKLPIFSLGFIKDAGVRRVLKLMVPALFGVSVAQIGLIIDNVFASYLPVGSISWLYYSDRLTYLPLGVIGVALSTVVLPHLSKQASIKDNTAFSKTLAWSFQMVWLIGLPAAIGLAFLAGPIIATLLYHGAFNAHSVNMTARALMAFSSGLPGFMLIKIGAPGFYARQKMATVVRIAALAVIINIILNALLIHPLAHAGLALATALASTLNAACLWGLLIKQKVVGFKIQTLKSLVVIVLASIGMAVALYFMSGSWQYWLGQSTLWRIMHLLMDIVIGVGIYLGICLSCGIRIKQCISP